MDAKPESLFLAENCQKALAKHGTTELVYVTAEMQPFSSQFKPDIYFKPNKGRKKGQLIFCEILPKFKFIPKDPVSFFMEKKEFAEDYLEEKIYLYLIYFCDHLDDLMTRKLSNVDILLLPGFSNEEEYIESLRNIKVI